MEYIVVIAALFVLLLILAPKIFWSHPPQKMITAGLIFLLIVNLGLAAYNFFAPVAHFEVIVYISIVLTAGKLFRIYKASAEKSELH